MLVKTLYVSVDPYMRGRMQDTKSYVEPFALDEALSGGVIAEVVSDGDQLKKAISSSEISAGRNFPL